MAMMFDAAIGVAVVAAVAGAVFSLMNIASIDDARTMMTMMLMLLLPLSWAIGWRTSLMWNLFALVSS